jgi:hypothetical protein
MAEEEKDIVQDVQVNDEAASKPKRPGRPRRHSDAPSQGDPEKPATEDGQKGSLEPEDATPDSTEQQIDNDPETNSDDESNDDSESEGEEEPQTPINSDVPKGRIVPEGEEVTVDTEEVDGYNVAKETVYRSRNLPNSLRKTYYLVAVAGQRIG